MKAHVTINYTNNFSKVLYNEIELQCSNYQVGQSLGSLVGSCGQYHGM